MIMAEFETIKEDIEMLAEASEEAKAVEEAEAIPETQAAEEEPEIIPSMDDMKEELEKTFRQIHVGDVLTGKVIDVDETGVLMDLNYFAPGFIPVEEMSSDPHFSVLETVRLGDEFTGIVKRRDDGKGNILLSKKEADDDLSWDKLKKMMNDHTVIAGKIKEVVPKGAILYVEGIRGFIPASKLALEYVENTNEYLNKDVEVTVADVNEADKRLVLSCKDLLIQKSIEEKNAKIARLTPGNIVEGKVESIKDYGAFVTIGDGISGLLHISQISDKRITNIHSVLKEGDTVKALITRVENGRVSLSMKALNDTLATEKAEESVEEYNDGGTASTSLGDLLKNLKFN